jgi:hypothetical protein
MITLQDIFYDLSSGEFSNLKLGDHKLGDPDSEPDPRTHRQLISAVNFGLTDLHTRFLLRAEEVYIQLHEEIATYDLDYRRAVSNTASLLTPKYITDTVAIPWNDNLLKIEQVYDEEGNLLFLNDPEEDDSLYTPRFDQVQVPWPNDYNTIAVQYRADHPTIVWVDGLDPSTTYLTLPRGLREALCFFVAARVYAALSGDRPEATAYWQKYLERVGVNKEEGLEVTPDLENNRFTDNGWA